MYTDPITNLDVTPQGLFPSETEKLTSLLLSGKKHEATQLSHAFLQNGHDLTELYEDVFKPSLYTVGRLWENNRITVADEHLATAIIERILSELYVQVIPQQYCGKKAVLACSENENHRVGLRMVADVLEMHEWETYFLGMGFPTEELIRFIGVQKPDLLALSLSVDSNFEAFDRMLNKLTAHFPHLPIIVGGQGLNRKDTSVQNRSGIRYLSSLPELHQYLVQKSA